MDMFFCDFGSLLLMHARYRAAACRTTKSCTSEGRPQASLQGPDRALPPPPPTPCRAIPCRRSAAPFRDAAPPIGGAVPAGRYRAAHRRHHSARRSDARPPSGGRPRATVACARSDPAGPQRRPNWAGIHRCPRPGVFQCRRMPCRPSAAPFRQAGFSPPPDLPLYTLHPPGYCRAVVRPAGRSSRRTQLPPIGDGEKVDDVEKPVGLWRLREHVDDVGAWERHGPWAGGGSFWGAVGRRTGSWGRARGMGPGADLGVVEAWVGSCGMFLLQNPAKYIQA